MNALDDSSLAALAVDDPDAFAALFDRFYGKIFTYIRYRCDDDATADDITAKVFEHLLQKIRRYSPERGAFAPWLFTIARNAVNDHWRSARRRKWISLDFMQTASSPEPSPEDLAVQMDEECALLAALSALPPRERDILGLKFGGGLTNRAIARSTGLKESHVGVIAHRAVSRLRDLLGEQQ